MPHTSYAPLLIPLLSSGYLLGVYFAFLVLAKHTAD